MTPGQRGRRSGASPLDAWTADAAAAGQACREEVSVAIESSAVPVMGTPVGERLGLPDGSRVLVQRAVRYTRPGGDTQPSTPDSLADEYYPYEMVRDTPLASPGSADPVAVLAGLARGMTSSLASWPGTAYRCPAGGCTPVTYSGWPRGAECRCDLPMASLRNSASTLICGGTRPDDRCGGIALVPRAGSGPRRLASRWWSQPGDLLHGGVPVRLSQRASTPPRGQAPVAASRRC